MTVKVIGSGVDTLRLNIRYTDSEDRSTKQELDACLLMQLDEYQAQAREAEEEVASPWSFHGARLFMAPHGAGKGQWRWLLTAEPITLCISRGRLNGIIAQVRFSSEYLWSCTWLGEALIQAHAFLISMFGERIHMQISELHLCADVTGWDVSCVGNEEHFVRRPSLSVGSRPENEQVHETGVDFAMLRGRRLATLEFGLHSSPISCSIYNKTVEIRQKSRKTWFYDLWKESGWDETSEVWRVEFRFRREFLHEMGIEEAHDMLTHMQELWAYATGSPDTADGWLRCVLPSKDRNRSRWMLHEAWRAIQYAFISTDGDPRARLLVRQRRRDINIKRGLAVTMGYLSTLAAWLGGEYAKRETDMSVVLGWLYEAGNTYLEQKKCPFQEIVQRKRERYGLPQVA
jgi:hypothetical protein